MFIFPASSHVCLFETLALLNTRTVFCYSVCLSRTLSRCLSLEEYGLQDVKETVTTIQFLLTYISNMIGDLKRKSTSDRNKKRALSQPKTPWKWFYSHDLDFPLVSEKYATFRPMHPFVEIFVDRQLEAYLVEEDKDDTSLIIPLICLLRTMKEGWGNQAGTKL